MYVFAGCACVSACWGRGKRETPVASPAGGCLYACALARQGPGDHQPCRVIKEEH